MPEPELVPFSKARQHIGVSEAETWLSENPEAGAELEGMLPQIQSFFGQTHKIGAVLELGISGARLAEQALYGLEFINGEMSRGQRPGTFWDGVVVKPMRKSQAGAVYLSQSNVVVMFIPNEEEAIDAKIHFARLEGSILACRVLLGIE